MVKSSASGISLTELTRVGSVLEVIVWPGKAQDVDHYRRAVLEAVKALVGADAGAYLVHAGRSLSWTSDFPSVVAGEYGPTMESTAPGVDIWNRHVALGVHHRDDVWAPICPDFYETSYFRDFLRVHGAFDSLGATWRAGPGRGEENVAQLLVHHDSPHGPRFGAKQRAILALLGPALRVGLAHSFTAGGSVGEFVGSAPAGESGWLLVDSRGAILHANNAARELFSADDAAEQTITRALSTVGVPRAGSVPEAVPGTWPPASRVTLGGCPVELRVTRTSLNGGRGTGYLVSFTGPGMRAPTPDFELLGLAKGLTPRQAEVVVLLCKRLRSREIAALLGLSLNTVRRHEERIFLRLGIHSRTDVKSALMAFD